VKDLKYLVEPLLEFFLLRRASKNSAALTRHARTAIKRQLRLAVSGMQAAERVEHREDGSQLAGDSIRRLVGAFALREGLDGNIPAGGERHPIWTRLSALPRSETHVTLLMQVCCADTAVVRELEFGQIARAFAWLESFFELRTPRELAFLRVVRSAAGVALLVVVAELLLAPSNLALRKPVTLSSQCANMPQARMMEKSISRAVDGVIYERPYAACTALEVHPWITVDLLREYEITEIVVHARVDCCWHDNAIPLSAQLSLNNKDFSTVATTQDILPPTSPWEIEVEDRRARYVRLYIATDAPKNIFVSEIEVYGRSP
jgi:hypothetical protein